MKNLIALLFTPILMMSQEPEKPTTTTTTTTTTISTAVSSESQKPSIFTKKHELKIGGIKALAVPIFEGTYEHLYSKDFTFGGALSFYMGSEIMVEKFSVTPFARFYFQETKEYGAKGIFVEGFAKYFSGDYTQNNWVIYSPTPQTSYTAFALGLSIGKKWVNSSGFVVEILGGGGRTLGSTVNKPGGVFRGDLNIGYRF